MRPVCVRFTALAAMLRRHLPSFPPLEMAGRLPARWSRSFRCWCGCVPLYVKRAKISVAHGLASGLSLRKELEMKSTIAFCLILLFCGIATAQEATDEANTFDVEKLYGDWEYVSGVRAGEEVAKERLVGTVSISKESFKIPGGPEGDFVMSYEIDSNKSPVNIDFKIESGPTPEGQAKGLIKHEGDKLWLCYEPMGGDRPEELASTEENGAFFFELKRKPS